MRSRLQDQPVQPKSFPDGNGTHALFAVATCTKCGATESKRQPPRGFNPHDAVKWFQASGWDMTINHTAARCPACVARRKEARMGEKPNLVKVSPAPEPQPAVQQQLRALTTSEKAAVRLLLDKHFDDSAGCYLDNYTDQRIGADANVPWAAVRNLRESAYGPLREPSELQKLRQEVQEWQNSGLEKLKVCSDDIFSIAAALRKRIDDAASKLGVN